MQARWPRPSMMWVFPTPEGPSRTTFSFRSMKGQALELLEAAGRKATFEPGQVEVIEPFRLRHAGELEPCARGNVPSSRSTRYRRAP